MPDPEQRVALAAAVAEGLLLYSAADVIHRSTGELDDVRSTIPVSAFGPRRRVSRWCQMCSSTPRTCTPSNRDGSSAARARAGWTWNAERVPGRAELPGEALDRRSLTAELTDRPTDRARAQQTPRGDTSGSCSRNVATLQAPSRQTQRRLRQRIRTVRPAQGASITSTTIRP